MEQKSPNCAAGLWQCELPIFSYIDSCLFHVGFFSMGIFVTFVTSSYLGILEKLTKGGSNAVLCRCQENSLAIWWIEFRTKKKKRSSRVMAHLTHSLDTVLISSHLDSDNWYLGNYGWSQRMEDYFIFY